MKVSLIIPIYNGEKYLYGLIHDLHAQNFSSVEFILVNDGSTDNTLRLVQNLVNKSKDERFKIFSKENGGVSSARNYGLKKAKGDYIMFMDADDHCAFNFVENYYNKITSNKNDIEIFDVGLAGSRYTNEKLYDLDSNFSKNNLSAYQIIEYFGRQKIGGYPFSYISKRILWKNNSFNENVHYEEDNLAFISLIISNPTISVGINSNYFYYYNNGNLQNTVNNLDLHKAWEGYYLVDKAIERDINSSNNPKFKCKIKFIYARELSELSTIIRLSLEKNDQSNYSEARLIYMETYKKAKIDRDKKLLRKIQYYMLKFNNKTLLKAIYTKGLKLRGFFTC